MLESLAFAFGEKPGDAISYAAVRRCSGVATSYRLASTWAGKSITTLRLSCSSSPFQRCHIVVATTHHIHDLSRSAVLLLLNDHCLTRRLFCRTAGIVKGRL